MTYIALHHSPDIPVDQRIVGYQGLWIDAEEHTPAGPMYLPHNTYAVYTGRTEVRDDGQAAEVWEIRLADASPVWVSPVGNEPMARSRII